MGPKMVAVIRSRGAAAEQGFFMYYTKGDAIGTKVSVRYRESGRLSGVVVKRGSTVHVLLGSGATMSMAILLNGSSIIDTGNKGGLYMSWW